MSDRFSFGNAVRDARKAKGISLRTLAETLGYSAPFVSDVEHGKRKPFVSDVALQKTASLLDLDLAHLRNLAHLTRHGAFLLPHVSGRHDETAAALIACWTKLKPRQLAAIRKALKAS